MASITAANAVIMLSIPDLFPVPQQLQGFAADDVFDTDAIKSVETLRGVDGKLSGGFVYADISQSYSMQADSASNFFFDQWWAAQQQINDTFTANGLVLLTAVGAKWIMTKGFLTSYSPIPAAKKLLQPRRHTITWETIFPTVDSV